MYRLFIDIPIAAANTEEAVQRAQHLVNALLLSDDATVDLRAVNIEQINYRLGHDDDRQKSNYFIKTTSGHVANKKSRIIVISEQNPVDTEEV